MLAKPLQVLRFWKIGGQPILDVVLHAVHGQTSAAEGERCQEEDDAQNEHCTSAEEGRLAREETGFHKKTKVQRVGPVAFTTVNGQHKQKIYTRLHLFVHAKYTTCQGWSSSQSIID